MSSIVSNGTGNTTVAHIMKDFQEDICEKLNDLDPVSAKIQLFVAKGATFFNFDKVIKKTGQNPKLLPVILNELETDCASVEIPKIFYSPICVKLDLFLKDANNQFSWLKGEHCWRPVRNESESEISVTTPMKSADLRQIYTNKIPILDQNDEFVD